MRSLKGGIGLTRQFPAEPGFRLDHISSHHTGPVACRPLCRRPIVAATIRFVRTGILLDDAKIHAPGILLELSLSVILAILLIAASIPLILPRF